jgi:hypothetical protein
MWGPPLPRGMNRLLERERRAAAWLIRERLVLLVPAMLGSLYLSGLRHLFSQDGWLALVAGREVAQHGLPRHEHLTIFAHGTRWVDQQWLSQLAMYELHRVGGITLVALVSVGLAVTAVSIVVVMARRNGASPAAIAIVGLVAIVPLSFVLGTVRTQVFGAVAFAFVLALLVADARSPSGRVWVVLPVLVVWTNLHGSVLLGAGLVVVRGMTIALLAPRRRGRGATLAAGGIAALFASPYVSHLLTYYRHTAFNPQFAKFVGEWQPATPSPKTALFYVLLAIAVWAFARRRSALTAFEWMVLLTTAAAGIAAVRNAGLFALAALMIVPVAFEARPQARATPGALAVALAPLALLSALVVVAAVQMHDWVRGAYPAQPARAIERIARANPEMRVFADVRFADWLLWRDPWLAGRVAFDARYELLSVDQINSIHRFNEHREYGWEGAAEGYGAVVLDEPPSGAIAKSLLARGGARIAYGARGVTVVVLRG